jgi:hypothetical protein
MDRTLMPHDPRTQLKGLSSRGAHLLPGHLVTVRGGMAAKITTRLMTGYHGYWRLLRRTITIALTTTSTAITSGKNTRIALP